MVEISDDELVCARCGELMERGYLNAGKGPFRWVVRPDQHKTILGGERIAERKRPWWGRYVVPAARCTACRFGVFAYGVDASPEDAARPTPM